jgi:hypothetical protein
MRSDGSMRAHSGTLILAMSCIQLANGFFGTFMSLRVAMEGFDATLAGLVLSSYFSGLRSARVRDLFEQAREQDRPDKKGPSDIFWCNRSNELRAMTTGLKTLSKKPAGIM